MDCEQFDRVALDVLYEEAGEYERGTAIQHLSHCSRCNGVYSRLKSAQVSAHFELRVPPPELADQVLVREHTARAGQGIPARLGRWMSIAAGYAMRPQVSMGALFLLMIGASLLFLRAHPGDRDNVHITEKGVPETEADASSTHLQNPPPLDSDAPGAAPAGTAFDLTRAAPETGEATSPVLDSQTNPDETFDAAERAYAAHHFRDATELYEKLAQAGGPRAKAAQLLAAQSDLKGRGCAAAVERFDQIYAQDPDSSIGSVAAWEAGNCYSQTGNGARARAYFEHLANTPVYEERARRSLLALGAAEEVPGATPAESAQTGGNTNAAVGDQRR